ncbi:hypothetical protein NE237_026533 [Protea cynaroides]|uniref:Uncharacterized protein n=1 Tax=Protea cynaroides TaxID=273540 RepID=A0A9Q0H3X2_9MAGN|nr:hypothetical protein NE237_026533 [Protea cynaroides]
MCNPGVLQVQRYVRREPRAMELVSPQAPVIAVPAAVAVAGDGGGESGSLPSSSSSTKQCVCSPTRHPGSFRCRQHHADYEWVRRIQPMLTATSNLSSPH